MNDELIAEVTAAARSLDSELNVRAVVLDRAVSRSARRRY